MFIQLSVAMDSRRAWIMLKHRQRHAPRAKSLLINPTIGPRACIFTTAKGGSPQCHRWVGFWYIICESCTETLKDVLLINGSVKFDKGKDEKSITAFKPGFRMVTGDPFARSADSGLPSQAIKFLCHNSEESAQGFPKQPCAGGIRTRLIFPSCSNGQLDSPDHKSHMAYPSGIEGGECPPGFPVRHPTLLYESVWQTQQFDKMWPQQGSNPFVLSNGDPTGFGFHGDFVGDPGFVVS